MRRRIVLFEIRDFPFINDYIPILFYNILKAVAIFKLIIRLYIDLLGFE